MKNISSKKTMSVIEAMLKSGLTLFLPFNFTIFHFDVLCRPYRPEFGSDPGWATTAHIPIGAR
jgi:hypothetical protein